ncbi:MAG: type II secretion system F family protein [Planctomycetota bacterium]|jgi:type IV pilus assembly protein PilC
MESFKYVASDSSGARRQGLTEAVCSTDVISWLREQGFTPISVDRVSTDVRKARRSFSPRRIKSADLAAVCWQLTTMVEGGITLTTALETIAEDIENRNLQKVLLQVLERMERGESFAESISHYPKVFNPLSYAVILAGESGGHLALALRRVAEYFDTRDKIAKKVKGAMAYPIFVFAFIVLIVIFIVTFIIPRFRDIFDQFAGQLPAFTRGFLGVYDVVSRNLVFILGGALALLILASVFHAKTKTIHRLFSRIALRLPLFGKILKQAFLTTFCRTMATLIEAGVPVLDVFDILAALSHNDVISTAITRTREYIVEGSSISLGMSAAEFFPNMVIKMTQVGEESGSLARVLNRTADYYERKVDSTITTFLALLEPTMILTIGAIVLVVVLALYLPIFTMSDVGM